MTTSTPKNSTPITSKNQLMQYIQDGFKPIANSGVGIEFESFLYQKKDFSPVLYHSSNDYYGISDILYNFNSQSWAPIIEDSNIIGLESIANKSIGNISLEPAGQFEFSSHIAKNLIELNEFSNTYWSDALSVFEKCNIGVYNLGYNPKFAIDKLPLMPKQRYNIMYDYMPKVGSQGRYMMKASATVQTNLDYSSEKDLAKKLRVSMAIAPLITALFANSPLVEGKLSNNLSHRMAIWEDTDNRRAGLLSFAFDEDFTMEKYVDYALQVPMYFIYRDNKYVDLSKITFMDYLKGTYKFMDNTPLMEDFILHLSTLFPDVRLKNYLEIRTADCVDKNYLMSLSALFVGLFYNESALDEALSIIKSWQYIDVLKLKRDVIVEGLDAKIYDKSINPILEEIVKISYNSLLKRGLKEEQFVAPILEIIQSKKTLAQRKIELFNKLGGNIDDFIKAISIN